MTIQRDFRFAVRQAMRRPVFVGVVVFMLALGIGANTAVYSIFRQVLIRPLPVRYPESLVLLSERSAVEKGSLSAWGDNSLYFSYPSYEFIGHNSHSLSGLAASAFDFATVTTTTEEADKAIVEFVSGDYFPMLGVVPIRGRLLDPHDDSYRAANPVVVLNEYYWTTHFGRDPRILQRSVRLNGVLLAVAGVVHYNGLNNRYIPAFFVPLNLQQQLVPGRDRFADPLYRWVTLIGRLTPGTSRAQAQSELNGLWVNWRRTLLSQVQSDGNGAEEQWMTTELFLRPGERGLPFLEDALGDPLRVLFGVVATVLLITCGNIAVLLSVRAVAQRRDLAVRAAIGASRGMLFRQVLVEGALVGIVGGIAGIAVAWLGVHLFLKVLPAMGTLRLALSPGLSWQMLLFGLCAGILTSTISNVSPAVMAARTNVVCELRSSSIGTGDQSAFRYALLVTEVALSMALLTCATLFSKTLYDLRHIDAGYLASHVITFTIDESALGPKSAQIANDYRTIAARLSAMREVRSVGLSSLQLLSGDKSVGRVYRHGMTDDGRSTLSTDPLTGMLWITPEFVKAMRIPVIAGRAFVDHDESALQKVVMVDEAFVARYFGGTPDRAIGQLLTIEDANTPPWEVVGVIPNLRSVTLQDAPAPSIYLPYAHIWNMRRAHPASFYVLTTVPPEVLIGDIKTIVAGVRRDVPITGLRTMGDQMESSLWGQQMMSDLTLCMGFLVLLVSSIGLYAVVAFALAQRKQEMSIRVALGASAGHVALLAVQRFCWVAVAGVIVGVPVTWISVHFATRFAVLEQGTDWPYLVAPIALLCASACASILPVRKVVSLDPMLVLRAE